MNIRLIGVLGAMTLSIAALSGCANMSGTGSDSDADYPTQPITLIVPFGAGGPIDAGARIIATGLEKELGAKMVIENRTGASGQTAYNALVAAPADGYTLAAMSTGAISGPVDPSIGASYTSVDFAPVARIVADPMMIAVRADSPYKSLQDVFDAALANPGQITISGGGAYDSTTMVLNQIEKANGANFAPVSFPEGSETPLLAGDLDIMLENIGDAYKFAEAGEMRVLAIATPERGTLLPEVPTFRELGLDIVAGSDRGFTFPAGTPEEIVTTISAAIGKTVSDPEVLAQFKNLGQEVAYLDAEEFQNYWNAQTERWREFVEQVKAEGN